MDKQPPLTADDLLERLDEMGIEHSTIDHPPLFTVAQSRQLRGDLPGAHVKNLFLRNKKGKMWLLNCKTTTISAHSLSRFLKITNHPPIVLDFE